MKTLFEQLQEAIKATGMTDKEIASDLRLSIPTIVRWRTGKDQPHDLMIPGVLSRLVGMKDRKERIKNILIKTDKSVRSDEAHFVNEDGTIVGKIVNIKEDK